LTAIALFICSLTRYEGWILLAIMSTIAWISFRNNRISYRKSEDLFFLFITIAAYGVVLWLAWNQLIFGDFLYFNRSTYAPWAIAQNALKSMDPSQKTSGDILLSLKVYGKTVLDNAGYLTSLLAMLGIFFFGVTKMNSSEKLTGLSLLFPFIFYVGALFLGFSVVIWHPSFTDGGNWGTRYGTFMMPAVGFFVAYLASKQKQAIQFVIAILVIISSVMSWNDGIISAGEAISNRDNPDAVTQRVAGEWFDQNYDRGLVLMQRFGNETFIFSSSVPLKKLVYEGSQEDFWNSTLNNPYESHVDWIVMRQRFEEPDTVWESLIDSQIVRDNYHIEYQAPGIIIYKINNPSS
jgi:hypothetical protein